MFAQIGEGLVLRERKKQTTKIRAKVITEIALGGPGGESPREDPAKKGRQCHEK